jgi:hypothetical protein
MSADAAKAAGRLKMHVYTPMVHSARPRAMASVC